MPPQIKDAYWFPHDSNAANDPKTILLIEQLGLEGYGIYWVLIECLREQPSYTYPLKLLPSLARRYGTSSEKIKTVVTNYDLFIITDDEFFYSASLIKRMSKYDHARENARMAGQISQAKRRERLEQRLLTSSSTPVEHPLNTSSAPVEHPLNNSSAPVEHPLNTSSTSKDSKDSKDSKERRVQRGELGKNKNETVFSVWEECTGKMMCQTLGQELGILIDEFGETKTIEAIKDSVATAKNGIFNVLYVQRKLEAWRLEGKKNGDKPILSIEEMGRLEKWWGSMCVLYKKCDNWNNGKDKAKDIFFQLRPNDELALRIIQAIRYYNSQKWDESEDQFIPSPVTFLEKKMWETKEAVMDWNMFMKRQKESLVYDS